MLFGTLSDSREKMSIKYCMKIGKMETETYQLTQTAFGDSVISQEQVFE
jgi:hypothetical protein